MFKKSVQSKDSSRIIFRGIGSLKEVVEAEKIQGGILQTNSLKVSEASSQLRKEVSSMQMPPAAIKKKKKNNSINPVS